MSTHILVTGGAGYIGSHTCKALAKAGYTPVVIDNLCTGNSWAVKWGPFVRANILDRKQVLDVLDRYKISAVIHFASSAYVGESMENPYKYLHNNVAGSLELFEAMRLAGIRKIVFSSSCATYGSPGSAAISEAVPQRPANPYGDSKLYIERALRWYGLTKGFRSVIFRYFNAAGADRDGEIGESHDPETHLIPLVIQAALGLAPPVRIMGADYDTPDGTAVRDYVHVEDLAKAHVSALAHFDRDGESIAMNLGMGRGSSVREIIAAVETVSARRVPAVEAPRRPGDPPFLVADARLAHATLSWQPAYSGIHDVVATAWEWHASRASRAARAG